MSKTIEVPNIAQWEENDSELAKYTIQQLLKTYDDLEEQYKSLMKQIREQDKRINKAIQFIELSTKMQKVLEKEPLNELQVKRILDILRGEDNE